MVKESVWSNINTMRSTLDNIMRSTLGENGDELEFLHKIKEAPKEAPNLVKNSDWSNNRRSVEVPDFLLRHPKHKPNLEELEPDKKAHLFSRDCTLPEFLIWGDFSNLHKHVNLRGIQSPSVGGSVAFN